MNVNQLNVGLFQSMLAVQTADATNLLRIACCFVRRSHMGWLVKLDAWLERECDGNDINKKNLKEPWLNFLKSSCNHKRIHLEFKKKKTKSKIKELIKIGDYFSSNFYNYITPKTDT